MQHTTAPRAVGLMAHDTLFPSPMLCELRDSSAYVTDMSTLQQRLQEDGYLFLRGLIPKEAVLESRRILTEALAAQGHLDPQSDPMLAIVKQNHVVKISPHMDGLTRQPQFRAVVEHPRIMDFFAGFFECPVMTFQEKWLRITPPGRKNYTGAHMDTVYMGRGTMNLRTCWIAHGDIPVELGPIALLPGSHRHPAFARIRETYGRSDVDRDQSEGWFTRDPEELSRLSGLSWASADMQPGDAVIFGMHLMHGSLANLTNRIRISSDTRYQPRDEPFDERWAGPAPTGHTQVTSRIPMDELRRRWQV